MSGNHGVEERCVADQRAAGNDRRAADIIVGIRADEGRIEDTAEVREEARQEAERPLHRQFDPLQLGAFAIADGVDRPQLAFGADRGRRARRDH